MLNCLRLQVPRKNGLGAGLITDGNLIQAFGKNVKQILFHYEQSLKSSWG
jgi:hypothetical protein